MRLGGKSDFQGSGVEASERTCRSRYAQDPRFGHQVATLAHFDV